MEWNRLAAERSAVRSVQERELASITRKLDGLIAAIAGGFRAPRLQVRLEQDRIVLIRSCSANLLFERVIHVSGDSASDDHALGELEAQRAALASQPTPAPPRLHPHLAEVYRARVAALEAALRFSDNGRAALEPARELIERIEVNPAAGGNGFEIELVGEIAAMVRLGLNGNGPEQARAAAGDRDLFARSVKVVAGAGNHRRLTPIRVAC